MRRGGRSSRTYRLAVAGFAMLLALLLLVDALIYAEAACRAVEKAGVAVEDGRLVVRVPGVYFEARMGGARAAGYEVVSLPLGGGAGEVVVTPCIGPCIARLPCSVHIPYPTLTATRSP